MSCSPSKRHRIRFLVLVALALCAGAPARVDALVSNPDVLLSISVTGLVQTSAPLRWVVYASKDDLPGIGSRGNPFRRGVAVPAGPMSVIEVGRVPPGEYFVIVGQDVNDDGDISASGEPRGYSGYGGCLLPVWRRGAQTVRGPEASITVALGCGR